MKENNDIILSEETLYAIHMIELVIRSIKEIAPEKYEGIYERYLTLQAVEELANNVNNK